MVLTDTQKFKQTLLEQAKIALCREIDNYFAKFNK
jgi:hypothetical protein